MLSSKTKIITLLIPAIVLAALVVLLVVLSLPSKPAALVGWSENIPVQFSLHKSYFELADRAEQSTNEQMNKQAISDFSFEDLAQHPKNYTGKILSVKGQVIDVQAITANPDLADWPGVERSKLPERDVYQTQIAVLENGAVQKMYFLHSLSFPAHLSPGDEVSFCGYFYGNYEGKIVEQKSGARAHVAWPLLVGKAIEPVKKLEEPIATLGIDLLKGITDRTPINERDNAAIRVSIQSADAYKAVSVSDLTYFDMMVKPDVCRDRVVRITGEVSRIEPLKDENVPADMKDYKRIVLTIDKDTSFTRYAAAYLRPDAAKEIKEMQVVTLRGPFIKVAELKGGRDKTADIPLIACVAAESVTWPKTQQMYPWLRLALVWLIVCAAVTVLVVGVIFIMVRLDKTKELEHHKQLSDIVSKVKKENET